MAASVGRFCKPVLLQPTAAKSIQQVGRFSTSTWSKGRKTATMLLGAAVGGAGTLLFALDQSVKAADVNLHPPKYPWSHRGYFASFDHASIRRGYEVYKQVCSACHSMQFMYYRQLIGVSHTEAEAKAEAAEIMVRDGPDAEGNYFMRPGKLADKFPSPYPNEEAARAANNGAYPPDLSLITLARHGAEDYIFALLTGYCDPPAGIHLQEGQYYNPYFVAGSGAISMAQALYNEVIEYSDGTPATASQLAKDVCTFLKWSAEPEHDTRKLWLIKGLFWFTFVNLFIFYIKRHKWSLIKSRKIIFKPVTK